MTISMYQASAPCFAAMLQNLSNILHEAELHCEQNNIDPKVLVASRLYPNMYPLHRQVQRACDHAIGALGRLARCEIPKHENSETDLGELTTLIEATIQHINSIEPRQIDGSEDIVITIKYAGREIHLSGIQYLLRHAIPNFYFHTTAAYGILRHNGVVLGKRDFIGDL